MEERDIKKVFELAKYNQLELLQWKVQNLTNKRQNPLVTD